MTVLYTPGHKYMLNETALNAPEPSPSLHHPHPLRHVSCVENDEGQQPRSPPGRVWDDGQRHGHLLRQDGHADHQPHDGGADLPRWEDVMDIIIDYLWSAVIKHNHHNAEQTLHDGDQYSEYTFQFIWVFSEYFVHLWWELSEKQEVIYCREILQFPWRPFVCTVTLYLTCLNT